MAQPSQNAPVITEKLRFLCLHGYRQNGDAFRGKIGSFRKSVQKYADFVFVTAPHQAPPLDDGDAPNPDQRSWWFNKDDGTFSGMNRSGPAFGFAESVALIEKRWHEDGPFHGLLGFSQGACFVGLLCSLASRGMTKVNPRYAIMAAGFCSGSLVHMAYYDDDVRTIQSMHILGTTDDIIAHEMSESLAEYFARPKIVRHSGGHFFPASADQKTVYVETMQDWLQDWLEEEELRRADGVEMIDDDGSSSDEDSDDDEDV